MVDISGVEGSVVQLRCLSKCGHCCRVAVAKDTDDAVVARSGVGLRNGVHVIFSRVVTKGVDVARVVAAEVACDYCLSTIGKIDRVQCHSTATLN